MNDLQREKALSLLDDSYSSLPMFRFDEDELNKQHALNCHLWAMQMIDVFNLPYRVLYAYFSRYGYEYMKGWKAAEKDGICLLNRCYPKPGYYIPDLVGVSMYIKKDVINPDVYIDAGPFKDDVTSTKYDLRTLIKDGTELKAEVEAKAAAQITWDLSTAEGIKEWKYQFAHFLNAAQFNDYRTFDWWGKKTAPNEEEEKINFWKCLQADYYMHTDNYRQEEPTCNNPDDYTLWTFYWNDRNEKNSTQYIDSMM